MLNKPSFVLSRIAARINSDHHFFLGVFLFLKETHDQSDVPEPNHHCLQPWPAPGREVVREFFVLLRWLQNPVLCWSKAKLLQRFLLPKQIYIYICVFFFPLCRGESDVVFVGGLVKVPFFCRKTMRSNEWRCGLHHKHGCQPKSTLETGSTYHEQPIFPKTGEKKQHLAAVFWPKMSPALVALQDYFASPLVYWSFLAAKRPRMSKRPKSIISFKWHDIYSAMEVSRYWWRMMVFCCEILTQPDIFLKKAFENPFLTNNQSHSLCFQPWMFKCSPKLPCVFLSFLPKKLDPDMFLFLGLDPAPTFSEECLLKRPTFGWRFCDNHMIFQMQKFLTMLRFPWRIHGTSLVYCWVYLPTWKPWICQPNVGKYTIVPWILWDWDWYGLRDMVW